MPSFTRGKKRDQLVAVRVNTTQQIYYQFNTKDLSAINGVSEADLQLLGHIKIGEVGDGNTSSIPAGALIFVRANAPKPPRVTKRTGGTGASQESVGTFCAVDRLKDALRGGWNLVKQGRVVGLSNNSKTVTAVAKLSNGALYAFPMNKADFDANKEALGLEDATTINTDAERAKLVRASSLPRPGKAKKVLSTGATFTSFYSTEAPLTEFQAMSQEVVL
jgi:hypothetical protein